MPGLKNIHNDGTMYIGFWQNVAIIDVGADMEVSHMKLVGSSYRTLLDHYPRGIAALVMIRAGTPVSSAEARAEGARFTKDLGDLLLHVAMVIEERGVIAQMLRSVVRGVNVLVRQTRLSLFDNIEEAMVATLPMIVPATTRANLQTELRSTVATARATFRPAAKPSTPVTRWF
ncbi:MAG TPA: hypothetical protein VHZ95_13755 [Polyangiales bacterium]|jgi:hypothetical protein|nr:hypothetical protein [Polyangiales bacterium]